MSVQVPILACMLAQQAAADHDSTIEFSLTSSTSGDRRLVRYSLPVCDCVSQQLPGVLFLQFQQRGWK